MSPKKSSLESPVELPREEERRGVSALLCLSRRLRSGSLSTDHLNNWVVSMVLINYT